MERTKCKEILSLKKNGLSGAKGLLDKVFRAGKENWGI